MAKQDDQVVNEILEELEQDRQDNTPPMKNMRTPGAHHPSQRDGPHQAQRQRMMRSYNRQNARYMEIHQTCETIIERQGIQNIYSGDYSHVIPMFYDMNKEF